ncbi:MAG: toxin-antitoxin system HicB family antitoxin [Rivularia sp. (in: cyanobacteria)]
MPKTLHDRLAEAADTEGVSLNQYIVFLLSNS